VRARLLICLLAAAAAVPAAAAGSATRPLTADLTVDYSPHGTDGPTLHWTLQCAGAKAAGSHPKAGRACRELARHRELLTKPQTRPCPLFIVRGAPESTVAGTIDGTHVQMTVRPACTKSTWKKLHVLLRGR
jgi:hypothetical protein